MVGVEPTYMGGGTQALVHLSYMPQKKTETQVSRAWISAIRLSGLSPQCLRFSACSGLLLCGFALEVLLKPQLNRIAPGRGGRRSSLADEQSSAICSFHTAPIW